MTQEQSARLLQAYRSAIAAGQDGIADMIEDVILEEMSRKATSPIFVGEKPNELVGKTRATIEPPWNVTCDSDMVSLGGHMECTGIDHLSKEMTV